ncbi:MAG: hypothetical protein K5790_02890 [Nitrosopumilus sp.]|uniref:hypothetical protein n=1 Tax=Nitrosopumilus sp. TaxID=2024843 RepID=UPI00247C189C|nr:hypothetical protein [Nitrosopumilus sp.]MCV0392223.1 hypothetical protein [Nitrosopumilus sp.]
MVSHHEYLKSILTQILDSYLSLQGIKDKPGDIELIIKELMKINGFIRVILNKIDTENIQSSDFKPLKSKLRYYLESYYFEQEIETMSTLYSNDVGRVKNMRLKILEALDDKKMMEDIKDLSEKL